MSVHDFKPIEMIEPGKSVEVTLGVDFHDTTQGAKIEILWETEVESKKQSVTINAPIGELIRPVTMSESLFIAEQGESTLFLFPVVYEDFSIYFFYFFLSLRESVKV